MGYGSYVLPDGREAGYLVPAHCDVLTCSAAIDRGLDYLCGSAPDGHRAESEPGCGKYFCGQHLDPKNHDCPRPPCARFSTDGNRWCGLLDDHGGDHIDIDDGLPFTETEED